MWIERGNCGPGKSSRWQGRHRQHARARALPGIEFHQRNLVVRNELVYRDVERMFLMRGQFCGQ
jgi:hypothetical protein